VDDIAGLLSRLQAADVPLSPVVQEAMSAVAVESFTNYDSEPFYYDRPLVFTETDGGGIKTISAPHMICTLLHHLELERGDEVLLLGAKGGYLAALINHIVGPEGGVTVVDPNRQVVEHVRERLKEFDGGDSIQIRKMRQLDYAPPNLPMPLNRVLVTGSLPNLPNWLESRIAEGGFVIAPIGGRVAQRLLKRELQGEWFDTDLGGVLFGPVDISETEDEATDSQKLAVMVENALELGSELDVFNDEQIDHLNNFIEQLRLLPTDLPPVLLSGENDPWEDDQDEFFHFMENTGGVEENPLLDLLVNSSDWITPLWPTIFALLETEMQHPGSPDAVGGDFGFGSHEDLVP